jgi:hypothetical protein
MLQQTIIIIGGILGVFILYFVGRLVIASVSPKTDEKIELYFIMKDIKRHFSFLFEKGFNIRSAEYAARFNGNWNVQFESKNCIIHIIQDRGSIEVSFTPPSGAKSIKDYVGLVQMIYLVTQSQVYVSGFDNYGNWKKKRQFEKVSELLREYIDQISHYFERKFISKIEL